MVSPTDSLPAAEFAPAVLRDYALLADGERGALIGPSGDIAWMCAPVWDADAVFSTLIGGAGCYAVTPLERHTWGGYYEPRTLVWNSRWVTTSGIVECRDALALPADPRTAVILRRVSVTDGRPAQLRVVLDVRAGFGARAMQHTHRDDRGTWTGRSGSLRFRWSGARQAHRARSGPFTLDVELAAGETHDFVLELTDTRLRTDPPNPTECWSATDAAWRDAVPEMDDGVVGPRDAEGAVAVLHGLTSSGGGMVASATMSLPERAQQGRNYDYRYAWIRDQCYAGVAAAAHRHFQLLDAAVNFVSARLLVDGDQLKPAYTVAGGPVPDERSLSHLSGYPGGADKAGNWVNHQFQLDAFGEALELFGMASRCGRLESSHWAAVERAVGAIENRWTEPDAGIWELDNERWAHSRLTCASGLRAVAGGAPAAQSGRWSALADAILADVSADCLHPDGRWQRSPDDSRIDTALLLPGIRGATPASDPRHLATIAAVEAELRRDDYVYRFRQDDRPLHKAEGAFLLCNFVLALAKQQQGDDLAARTLFERGRSASGPAGLLAEEFDVRQRQLRGNLPQAFVHALLLEGAARLGAPTNPSGNREFPYQSN